MLESAEARVQRRERWVAGTAGAEGKPGRLGQFRAFTYSNSTPGSSLQDRLRGIGTVLREGGYEGDAEALKAVLGPQGLYQ